MDRLLPCIRAVHMRALYSMLDMSMKTSEQVTKIVEYLAFLPNLEAVSFDSWTVPHGLDVEATFRATLETRYPQLSSIQFGTK